MKTTSLHAVHTALGAKMGEFAGYDMPLYYAEGVLKEHEWTRSHASLFDVSHMGQIMLSGKGACRFLEEMTPSVYGALPIGRAKYTVFANKDGGIIDDFIVTRMDEDRYSLVVNAGRKDIDIPLLEKHLPDDVDMDVRTGWGLVALQGPESEKILRESLGIDTSDMPYMWGIEQDGMLVSRLGYTGEDGFEIAMEGARAEEIWNRLLEHPDVKPAGLAARDSLRLEMGYPLYGNDIDETTSVIEAGLGWIIGKDHDGFIGAAPILQEQEKGAKRQRVGIRLIDRGVAREGAELRDDQDQKIGMITSGGFSPTLKASIGQGYVETPHAVTGQKIFVNIRGNNIAAEIVPMPFTPSKTKSMKRKPV